MASYHHDSHMWVRDVANISLLSPQVHRHNGTLFTPGHSPASSPRTAHAPNAPAQHSALRVGGWLPAGHESIVSYVGDLQRELERRAKEALLPETSAFLKLIEEDLSLRFLASQMISQVPAKYAHDPTGGPRLKSFKQMVRLIDMAIRRPPPYNSTELVGFPINAILDWSMGTNAGTVFFLNEKVNKALGVILNAWCRYLNSEDSLVAFSSEGGWASQSALDKLNIAEYEHTAGVHAWGFKSWNDFFTRKFKPGMRPVADPSDPRVITSACESTPFAIQNHVQKKDTFWIKAQPYSLDQLLASHHVDAFVDGTVYQAFLSAFNYHRWHSPVSGRVVEAFVQPGSYYAEAPALGYDPSGPNLSQGYIAHVAARAIIFIEAAAPIGLMAVVCIGMAEVSSNIITVKPGQELLKGDELGYFQFGGSTHCLVFRPGVIESFAVEAIPGPHARVVRLNTKIATARAH